MVPVIGALPWLAAAMTSIFVWFVNFFANYLGRRFTIIAGVTLSYFALTSAFILASKLLIDQISTTIPGWLESGAFMIPTNVALCFGVMMGTKVYRWIYDYKAKVLFFLLR